MKKNILLILCVISICTTICVFLVTYSRYAEEANADMELSVGKWSIKLNNTDIAANNAYDFTIEDINISESENVLPGKIAPGITGYFDIEIDPSGTDVSVKYELTIHIEELENSEFKISSVSELNGNELIKTGEQTYVGIILLEDVKQDKTNTIRINVNWVNNELNNVIDSEMGSVANSVLEVPITVKVSQYLGEKIIPIEEEEIYEE